MKNFLLLGLIVITVLLTGCASGPSPKFINGAYYLGGDSNCVRYRQTNTQREDQEISCYTSDGVYTGTRSAMTYQQMQMWAIHQENQRRDYEQMMRNRPVYTNCYTLGGQVFCNSY